MTRQEQCACGNEARVPEGELKPDGWMRMRDGSLQCDQCTEAWWRARGRTDFPSTSPGCQEEAT